MRTLYYRQMQPCPWSNGQLRKLGTCIREGTEPPAGTPSYDEVLLWYNDLATHVQRRIEAIDWRPLLGDRLPEVTSRPKTIDTLREKLIRQPHLALGRIQDIAGVRFEADMTLSEQDAVAVAIAGALDHEYPDCAKDMRKDAHSGYRAVHLWLRISRPVEVQIRTHLQGEWANMYEAAGDLFGRDIRYDVLPSEPAARRAVQQMQSMSLTVLADMELTGDEVQKVDLLLSQVAGRIEQIVPRTRQERRLVESYQENKRNFESVKISQAAATATMRETLQQMRYSFQNATGE